MDLPARVKREIGLAPKADREDLTQEAYLAMLEGGDPLAAVWKHKQRNLRHRKRFENFTDVEARTEARQPWQDEDYDRPDDMPISGEQTEDDDEI